MWLDKIAFSQWLKLRDKFGIKNLVETGTAHGIGARFYAHHFEQVYSCDINPEMIEAAQEKCQGLSNVRLFCQPSPEFLAEYWRDYRWKQRKDIVFFLLDAHWYKDWPILGELRALRGFENCVIVIHDFKIGGLGYVSYGGQDLDLAYVGKALRQISSKFHFYHNDAGTSQIYTKEEVANGVKGLVMDKETEATLNYAWSSESKNRRGMLYAVPEPLDSTFKLKELK